MIVLLVNEVSKTLIPGGHISTGITRGQITVRREITRELISN